MADTKSLEREYVINLRREWLRVPYYERTGRAVKAIKKFIARHMKISDRDLNKVKLDVYFNNQIWMRGKTNPPAKVKVKATKIGDIVKVTFVQEPANIKFLRTKNEKYHKAAERPVEQKVEKQEEKKEQTPQEKVAEKEKEKSVAQERAKEIKQEVKAEKHLTKVDKASHPQRMALQK